MSASHYAVTPVSALRDRRLSHLDARHYALLIAHTDRRTAMTWISRARMALELGVSERSVSSSRRRLEEAGHIARVAGGHRGMTTRILISEWVKSAADRARVAVAAARWRSDRDIANLLAGLRRQSERVKLRSPGSSQRETSPAGGGGEPPIRGEIDPLDVPPAGSVPLHGRTSDLDGRQAYVYLDDSGKRSGRRAYTPRQLQAEADRRGAGRAAQLAALAALSSGA